MITSAKLDHTFRFFNTTFENQITGSAVYSTPGYFMPKASFTQVDQMHTSRYPSNEFDGLCPVNEDVHQGQIVKVSFGDKDLGDFDVLGVQKILSRGFMVLNLKERAVFG